MGPSPTDHGYLGGVVSAVREGEEKSEAAAPVPAQREQRTPVARR